MDELSKKRLLKEVVENNWKLFPLTSQIPMVIRRDLADKNIYAKIRIESVINRLNKEYNKLRNK